MTRNIITILLLLFSCFYTIESYAQDIYIIHSGKDKHLSKEIKRGLPKTIKAKSYNVDLLVLADYSGKQKVIAKLSKAKLLVFIKNEPTNILGDSNFPNMIKVSSSNSIDDIMKKFKEF